MTFFRRPTVVSQVLKAARRRKLVTTRCPACRAPFLGMVKVPGFPDPCPTCKAPLEQIGAIGIDQAVAIIAAARGSSQPGARR